MFKSQLTGKTYPPGIASRRVVVERRFRRYVDGETGKESFGHEIVKELVVGPDEEAPEAVYIQDKNRAEGPSGSFKDGEKAKS